MGRIYSIIGVAVVLLAGGAAVMWYLSVYTAEAEFEEWAEALRADGYEVTLGDISVSGFPKATEAILAGLEISRPTDSYAWRWSARQVHVVDRLDSENVSLRVRGAQQLSYVVAGEERSARLGAQRFNIGLRRGADGRIEQITAELGEFVLRPHGAEEAITAYLVQVELTRAEGADAIPDGSKARLRIDQMVAPDKRTNPLGSRIEEVYADVTLQHGLDSLDLGKALPAWRASPNAKIRVGESRLFWGPLNLEADGTVTLDEQLRPQGRLDARIHNFIPAIDALYDGGRIDGKFAADYRATLLEEVGKTRSATFEFVVTLVDGNIELLHDYLRLGILNLGTLTPVLPQP